MAETEEQKAERERKEAEAAAREAEKNRAMDSTTRGHPWGD